MKPGIVSLLLLAAGVGALTACKKTAPEVVVEPEPIPAATPVPATPVPATPIAAATPMPDPIAPPGIFFLLQAGSVTTEDGIIGLKPGQVVRQVSPGMYEVGGQTVALRDDQVTNNLRIARQFAAADAAIQAASRQALQPPPPAKLAPVRSGTPAVAATPVPRPAARPVAPPDSPLSGGPKLGAGTGRADPETANKKNAKMDSSGRPYWRDSRGNIRYDF